MPHKQQNEKCYVTFQIHDHRDNHETNLIDNIVIQEFVM